ncbi:MAG: hypothetical protein AB7C91_06160 [Sphaerochaeta sp.]|jgi:hypothetical protein|uniref:hypothetical protein n=1 Tax=Sphaerochaeta sp. TaxID=1972642 RepID=UPI002FCA001C
MAKKGFFHAFLSSITVAVLSFFIMYFFIPSMSMQFLGVSFAYRAGTVNALVLDAVNGAVDQVRNNPEFTKESFARLQSLLSSKEVQQKLTDAAKQGEQVLQDALKQVTDMAK